MGVDSYRHMEIATPLGGDELTIRSMRATEPLGEPFDFDLVLEGLDENIRHEDLLGQNMTVRLNQQEKSPGQPPRFFNGYVADFRYAGQEHGYASYNAKLRPAFWFLRKTSDCRIFQDESVTDIIKKIVDERGISNVDLDKLTEAYDQREYCVQYRESDFAFLSRLMTEEGIYYYFIHENGKHTMVLADGPGSHGPAPRYERVPYYPPSSTGDRPEHLNKWSAYKQLETGQVESTDYDFKKPNDDLTVRSIALQAHSNADHAVFQYPGGYRVSGGPVKVAVEHRRQALTARYELMRGAGDVRGFSAGHTFKLDKHTREDTLGRDLLLVNVNMTMVNNPKWSGSGASPGCTCSIDAIDASVTYRPVSTKYEVHKPVMPGPQTAVVTGPKGEEIHTDEYGRVQVKFHWDRHTEAGKETSGWIRVSQTVAGRGWGAMSIPRIGQEVIVDFLDGDPDRPIVTGRVYNGANMPPYKLPEFATYTTFKSNSSKGGQGFNELRFEDKKGAEQIFVHAEKDQDIRVKNDRRDWIGNDTHEFVTGYGYEQLKHKHLTVTEELREYARNASLTVAEEQHEEIGSRYAMKVGNEVHIAAGSKIVLEANASVTLKVGGSFLTVTPSGISASGTINLNSGGSPGEGGTAKAQMPDTPNNADNDEAGEVAEPVALGAMKTGAISEQATNLIVAAQNGTAFCQFCENA